MIASGYRASRAPALERRRAAPACERIRCGNGRANAAAVVAAAAALMLAGCVPGGKPGRPESSGLSFPTAAEAPLRPDPALAPYVVNGSGRSGDNYTVSCIPKREFDVEGGQNPDHEIELPVTRRQLEAIPAGGPCPLPPDWHNRPADRR
ncbi:hypothetical protein [Amycolatopsis sp. NPDC004079]|uniref:hypothetical protein n=1 Tax=Amycolatopsis sp. NPDC004079 TaxID=3154549 RepID=UPI0033BE7EA7